MKVDGYKYTCPASCRRKKQGGPSQPLRFGSICFFLVYSMASLLGCSSSEQQEEDVESIFKSTPDPACEIQCCFISRLGMKSAVVILLAFELCLRWAVNALPNQSRSNRSDPDHPDLIKDKAIERLSQVFGMPTSSGGPLISRDPPQYMLDLYNSIADENGVTRSTNPYNATIIRSFVNKGSANSDILFFNVSGIESDEEILQAELRLYRHKHRGKQSKGLLFRNLIYMVQVYQITDVQSISYPERNRLLITKYVDVIDSAWETFNINAAAIDWISGQSQNLGLLVVTTSLQGHTVKNHLFHDSNDDPDSLSPRVPILVLFSTNHALSAKVNIGDLPEVEDKPVFPTENKYDYATNMVDRKKRSLSSASGRHHHQPAEASSKSQLTEKNTERSSTQACALGNMYVDFDQIGWSSWIIFPKGYNAHACRGHCSFPLGQNQRPTNHATVQSIVNQLNLVDVGKPCCVPNRLLSLSLLYYDDQDNVVLKQYEDMVADGCGCL